MWGKSLMVDGKNRGGGGGVDMNDCCMGDRHGGIASDVSHVM